MSAAITPTRHRLLLMAALGAPPGLVPGDLRRTETHRHVQECRSLIASGVACEHASAVPGKGTQNALQAFMEAQTWHQYPECVGPLSDLFAAYVRNGYILVDGPAVRVQSPGNKYPDHWLPLEQAVVTPCMPTLLALIDNGADASKVEGGDLFAFIRKSTPQTKVDQMLVEVTEAIMRRQISLVGTTASSTPASAQPASRRSPGV